MNGKLISAIVVLLMIIGSFSAIGIIKNDENSFDLSFAKSKELNYDLCTSSNDPPGYQTGLLGIYDEDLWNSHMGAEAITEAPDSFDWTNVDGEDWTTPIRDQAACGSCYSFGALASLEATYKIINNNPGSNIDLSEQHVVSCGSEISNSGIMGCCGAYFDSTLKFIKNHEAYKEDCFDYQDDRFFYNHDDCPPYSDVSCDDSSCTGIFVDVVDWVSVPSNIGQIQSALVEHGPLVTDIYVPGLSNDGGCFRNYPNDKTYVDENDVYYYDYNGWGTNHMVCLVGYEDTPDNPNYDGYWIIKNSWDTDWGLDGYLKIGYDCCNVADEVAYFTIRESTLTLDLEIPGAGFTNEDIEFKCKPEGGSPKYTYSWDFNGDGSTDSTEQNPTFNYGSSGIYTVTLTVEDRLGNSITKEQDIAVFNRDTAPRVNVDVSNIIEIDDIECSFCGDPEWEYVVSVKGQSGDSWNTDLIATERMMDVKIRLIDSDSWLEGGADDLADISPEFDPDFGDGGYTKNYDDFALPFKRPMEELEQYAAFIVTYDMASGNTLKRTADGSEDGYNGDQNDASLDVVVDTDYVSISSVDIISPSDGAVFEINDDQPIDFEGSAVSGGCQDPNMKKYIWDFDDSSGEIKGKDVSHTYSSVGEKTVTLTATDRISSSSDSISITVASKPVVSTNDCSYDESSHTLTVVFEDEDSGDSLTIYADVDGDGVFQSDEQKNAQSIGNNKYSASFTIPVLNRNADTVEVKAKDSYGFESSTSDVNNIESEEKTLVSPLSILLDSNLLILQRLMILINLIKGQALV